MTQYFQNKNLNSKTKQLDSANTLKFNPFDAVISLFRRFFADRSTFKAFELVFTVPQKHNNDDDFQTYFAHLLDNTLIDN